MDIFSLSIERRRDMKGKRTWLGCIVTLVAALAVAGLVQPACGGDDDNGNGEDCGNGTVDTGEKCDKGITEGEGACPASCEEDSDPCTTITLTGSADDCTAECLIQQAACANGDGCCPAACNNNNDDDCEVECGNGAVEGDEKCDGNCPTSCPNPDPCQVGTLIGSADDCDAECAFDAITDCIPGDNCCPEHCTNQTDADCVGPIGEGCTEDAQCSSGMCATAVGFGLPGGYCSADCSASPAVCGAGAHCGVERFSLRFCNKSCTTDDDCRTAEGYACFDADGDGIDECAAVASGSGQVGDTCTVHTDCAGGQRGACAAEESSATADGYCTVVLCDDQPGSCPAGSHCALEDTSGTGFCLKDCGSDGDCRSHGYACYDADADGSSECWIAGTGAGAVGDACELTTDCGGGAYFFCYLFWDGGYCTANCLEGVGTTCPAGSNCFNFGGFASCLKACEFDVDCRDGYTCVDNDGQDGAECIPG
jgi:hypothetical protein